MSSESVVTKIVAERPWILYVLMALLDMGSGEFTAKDISEALGVRSYVVQRALWWLKKYGFVEEIPGTNPRRYKLKSVEDPRLANLRGPRWKCGNTTVIRIGKLYIAFINRVNNVVTRVVPEEVVECIKKLALESLGLDASKVAQECGCGIQEAVAAMRVVNTLMCKPQSMSSNSMT